MQRHIHIRHLDRSLQIAVQGTTWSLAQLQQSAFAEQAAPLPSPTARIRLCVLLDRAHSVAATFGPIKGLLQPPLLFHHDPHR
jgi:hypothetical protein